MDTLYFVSMMMVFAILPFWPHWSLFGFLKNYVWFFQFIPLFDVSLNLITLLAWNRTFLLTIFLKFVLAETPYHDSKSQTRLSLLETFPKTCTLVYVILFNYLKMNNMIDSPPNLFLVNSTLLKKHSFFALNSSNNLPLLNMKLMSAPKRLLCYPCL